MKTRENKIYVFTYLEHLLCFQNAFASVFDFQNCLFRMPCIKDKDIRFKITLVFIKNILKFLSFRYEICMNMYAFYFEPKKVLKI